MTAEVAKVPDALRLSRIRKIFGGVTALDDVAFTVGAGEVHCLAGENGCGKSTLLAILSGLQQPDRGSASALGHDLSSLDTRALENFRLRHTGFVFQGFNLFPALTAQQQVELPLSYLGLPSMEVRARAIEALEEAGVEGRVGDEPLGTFRYLKMLRRRAPRWCVVSVYPLQVLIQLGAWPEDHQRQRRWMTPQAAAAAVNEPDLAALILEFAATLPTDEQPA